MTIGKYKFKLGRKAVITDSRTLHLEKYLADTLVPPVSVNWAKGVTSFGPMENDTYGCCVIAAIEHAIQIWTLNAAKEVTESDADILEQYAYWCQFDPTNPTNTDNGCSILPTLNYWKKYTFSGKVLKAFLTIDTSDIKGIKNSINLFGGAFIGLNVPNYIMNTVPNVWDVQPADGIAGGHCVQLVGYDADTFTFISWGNVYSMTNQFFETFVDEAYCLLSPLWMSSDGYDPTGLDMGQLDYDLQSIV